MKHLELFENYESGEVSPEKAESELDNSKIIDLEASIIKVAMGIAINQMGYNGEIIDNMPDALACILSETSLSDKFDSSVVYDYFKSLYDSNKNI